MQPKVIFISIPWFSPAFKAGGPIQSIVNMVETMKEGYVFFIYTSNTDLHNQPISVTYTNQWVDYNDWTKVWYAGRQERSQHIVEQIASIKPDIVFIIGLFDWHFNIVPLLFTKQKNKILSVRGMLHPGALRQKQLKKSLFVKILKLLRIKNKVTFHATDKEEAVFINKLFGEESKIQIASNFPRIFSIQATPPKIPGYLKLVSIGIISPMKNYLLVIEALKEVKIEIEYSIYGSVKDDNYWEKCLNEIRLLPENIRVEYKKELSPSEVSKRLGEHQVFILPSESENFGHAIIEALSAGLPVITSNNTPWTNLEEKSAGINASLDKESIIKAINYFAEMNEETFQLWKNGAKIYTEQLNLHSKAFIENTTLFNV